MASLHSREGLEHRVVLLRTQGMSKRAIARSLRMGRNRVNRILAKHRALRQSGHSTLPRPAARAPRPSKLDPYQADIKDLLDEYPDITAQRVFEEITAKGYEGGISILKERVRALRPKPPATISLPTPSYGPGEMAESDWSVYTVLLCPATGTYLNDNRSSEP